MDEVLFLHIIDEKIKCFNALSYNILFDAYKIALKNNNIKYNENCKTIDELINDEHMSKYDDNTIKSKNQINDMIDKIFRKLDN